MRGLIFTDREKRHLEDDRYSFIEAHCKACDAGPFPLEELDTGVCQRCMTEGDSDAQRNPEDWDSEDER